MSANTSDSRTIAARYAHALFMLASEKKTTDAVETNLTAFGNLLASSEQLQRFLRNPVVTREESAEAVQTLLESLKASELTRKFFLLLAESRRLAISQEIIEAFLKEAAQSRGEVHAEVIAASEL